MKTSVTVAVSIVVSGVFIGIGFLIGYCVRDTVNPDMDRPPISKAICQFAPNDQVQGEITIIDKHDGFVEISGNLTGVEGRHGFHIHTLGNTANGCKSASGHFNPDEKEHGAPMDDNRHVGDLGNIDFANRQSIWNRRDSLVKLSGINSVIGRSFVIHQGQDDMGKGGAHDSKTSGNAGPRLACCVIGIAG
jgi:Cu-Zn family superoxide dismutase